MMVQRLSPKRWYMLAIYCIAIFINEIPLTNIQSIQETNYIEYFIYFPLFYTAVHWIEEVGHYQTMMYAMVYQLVSVLYGVITNPRSRNDQNNLNFFCEVFSAVAQVYLFNGITKFTGQWFGNRFRPIATALILIFSQMG